MKITTLQQYKEQFTTVFTGDFKALFVQEAAKLIEIHLPLPDRIDAVEFLTERYFEDVSRMPEDTYTLDLLSSHILYESLEGDDRPDKITLEEFPVMTETQTKRRRQKRGEISVDVTKACLTIGNDGRNYREPTRRIRKQYEHDKVEKLAAEKARSENAAYMAATSPSKITRKRAA